MPKSCNFQADNLLIRLDITLKADVNAISPIADSVLDTARRMGCGQGHEPEIELPFARPRPTQSITAVVAMPPRKYAAALPATSHAEC